MDAFPTDYRKFMARHWHTLENYARARTKAVRRTVVEKYKTIWHKWYTLQSYLKSALWVVPIVAMLIEEVLGRLLIRLDARLTTSVFSISAAGSEAIYQTVITFALSYIVFTFGSLLVAIQVAGGQMTPRVIATALLRDNIVRCSVGLFVVTLLLAVKGLARTDVALHELLLAVVGSLGLACLAVFLYLIDYAARLLRPGSIVAKVGDRGLAVIDTVYPDAIPGDHFITSATCSPSTPDRIIYHERKSAVIIALNLDLLLREAERANCVIEFVPQVGDLIAVGEPLFLLYGSALEIDERKLQGAVATGSERAMEHDPMFAFRILVDIALKALSRAINDPTTAVLAIDQLHRLLRALGRRRLSGDEIRDRTGNLRLIFRTPNWEDYVRLTFTELRLCGVDSMQVARRLRAMVVNLLQTLPERRHPALQHELDQLDCMVQTAYSLPGDRALAAIPDSQGLGAVTKLEASLRQRESHQYTSAV